MEWKKYMAAAAVLGAILMGVLDGTIMNVALPTLAAEFGVTASEVIWVTNSYQLVVTMFLLGCAATGDVWGYRKVFLCGVSIFVLGSLGCACSHSFHQLIACRVIQGCGVACTMSINTALIRLIFPPRLLGRVIGTNAVVVAATAAGGPTLGGLLVGFASWRWIFLLNIPLGLLAIIIGWRILPENPAPPQGKQQQLDIASVALNAMFFGLLIYGVELFAHGEQTLLLPLTGAWIAVGVVYVRRQLGLKTPILPIDLLKGRLFALSVTCSIFCFVAQMLALVSIPFLMQKVWGRSVVETGMLITPWPLATSLTAPLAGRLIEKVRAGLLGGMGMLVFVAGLACLYLTDEAVSTVDIGWRMAMCGVGIGLFQTPNNVTITASAPLHRSGGASGMLGTARLLGQTLGTALVAIFFRLWTGSDGVTACLWAAMGFAAAAGIVSIVRVVDTKR